MADLREFTEMPRCALPAQGGPLPLVVDLDGGLLRRDPASAVASRVGLARSLGALKDQRLARRRPDLHADRLAARFPDLLVPHDVNPDVMDLIRVYGRFGADVLVISRASVTMAERIVAHLGLRTRVYGSDSRHRLDRVRKARVVEAVYGPHGFAFVGPSRHREELCLAARQVVGIGGSEATRARLLTFGVTASFLPSPDWKTFDLRAGALLATYGIEPDGLNARISRDIWGRPSAPLTSDRPDGALGGGRSDRKRA